MKFHCRYLIVLKSKPNIKIISLSHTHIERRSHGYSDQDFQSRDFKQEIIREKTFFYQTASALQHFPKNFSCIYDRAVYLSFLKNFSVCILCVSRFLPILQRLRPISQPYRQILNDVIPFFFTSYIMLRV